MTFITTFIMLCLFLFSLLGYCLTVHRALRIPLEFTPFFTLSSIILCLYCIGWLGTFHYNQLMIPIGFNKYTKPDVPFLLYGSYSIFVSGLFCMGFQFYSLRRNLKIVTGQLVNFPLILFFVIAGLLFFPMQTYQLRHWDEFTHWGLAVKDMLCYHAFPAGDTTIMFPNYLPGSTLSHYYISILTTNTEGTWYYSQLLLLLSGIFVFTVAIPKKHCFFILLILFFGLTLLFTFNETGLISLYTDALLGIFFGAVLYMYLYLSITNILPYKKTVLLLIPPLCTLVLIKHVGIIFVSVVFVMIFFDLILSYFISVRQETIKIPLPWNRVKIRNFIVNIILFLSLLVLPTAMNTSWTIRIKHCDIKSQADTNANAFGRKMGKTLYKIHSQIPVYQWHWVLFSSKNADQFAEVTRSSLSDWQWEVLQNYEKIIKERPLYAFFSSYTSIISILFLSCLLCLSPSMCGFRYKFLIFTFVMFLGCCGYLLFILLTFLFAFAPNFSIAFASYERYVGTYFYAWLLCLFSFSLFCFQKSLTHGNKDCYFSWTTVVLLIAIIIAVLTLRTPNIDFYTKLVPPVDTKRILMRQFITEQIPKMKNIKNILLVTRGRDFFVTKYELHPYSDINLVSFFFPLKKYWLERKTDGFIDLLTREKIDTIVLDFPDHSFWNTYGNFFGVDNIPILEDKWVYRVAYNDDGTIRLERLIANHQIVK